VLLRIDQPFANHNGGQLQFGPDGYLYIGMGDGGSGGDPDNRAQNLSDLLGKLLRIDVDVTPYGIPPTNPFVGHAGTRPEIWALGLRNPWRFSFDLFTGDLWIADVGQGRREEVDFQPASSIGGENYGWNYMCGTHPFPVEKEQAGEKTPVVGILPVAEYSHATDGICVIGLGVYRGSEFPNLDGVYFAGDWGSGRLWGIAKGDGGKWQMQELLNTSLNLTSGGEDEAGNIYVCNATSQYGAWNPFESERGSVWKLVAADKAPANAKKAPMDNK
jgi:glucose/arabinose dehydrogenase